MSFWTTSKGQSIDLAFDTNIPSVIITGDFNMNYPKILCRNKLKPVFSQKCLLQLIDEPTHYTETSSSLIDLTFTTNVSSVSLSSVGEAFLDQNTRYHCPVYVVLNFEKYKFNVFRGKYGNTIAATMKL